MFPPPWTQNYTSLREVLIGYYTATETILEIATEAQLDLGSINSGGTSRNVWHSVLNEARKQGLVDSVIMAVAQRAKGQGEKRAEELRQIMASTAHILRRCRDIP